MRNKLNRVDPGVQLTEAVEGFGLDGVDGSQMIFWTCRADRETAPHSHDCDASTPSPGGADSQQEPWSRIPGARRSLE